MRRSTIGLALCSLLLAACTATTVGPKPSTTTTTKPKPATASASTEFGPALGYRKTAKLKAGPYLAPGSNPSVLPGDVLIADRNNNRLIVVNPQGNIVWSFPRPGDLQPGQSFGAPDDAFFTPNGKNIIVTQESKFAIAEVNIATHRIVWQYGHWGVAGMAPGYLDNPDDAMMLPNGDVLAADI
ncbi:MAG: hypothetical protein M0Z87_09480, partial [Actinomycetota bacterium]|nr:hypothetical protein [Actinomycetota bacterium]